MPRLARVVLPGLAHHLLQRGNRRQAVFFHAEDRHAYLTWLAEASRRFGFQVWAYCLMTNHVHLVAVPETVSALGRGMAYVHRHYAHRINRRMGWTGHLWQARFGSSPMDARYSLAAVRYVEQNPVRAGLVASAWDYPWSSAAYHVGLRSHDPVVEGDEALRADIGDWRVFLEGPVSAPELRVFRAETPACRPVGSVEFVERLEAAQGVPLRRQPAGRPRKRGN
jgi:putative transposase